MNVHINLLKGDDCTIFNEMRNGTTLVDGASSTVESGKTDHELLPCSITFLTSSNKGSTLVHSRPAVEK